MKTALQITGIAILIAAIAFVAQLGFYAFLLYRGMSQSADPYLELFDPHSDPLLPEAEQFFNRTIHDFETVGFSDVAYVHGTLWNQYFCMALLKNKEKKDYAAAYFTGDGMTYIEYGTEFENHLEINTNNCGFIEMMADNPDHNIHSYPDVHDTLRLYDIHQAILVKYKPSSLKVLTDKEVVESVRDDVLRELKYQLARDILKLDTYTDTYSPTVWGAVLMGWNACFPVELIRTKMRRIRDNRLIEGLGD